SPPAWWCLARRRACWRASCPTGSPRIAASVRAACRLLPLGFGGQAPGLIRQAREPPRIEPGVKPSDEDHWMVGVLLLRRPAGGTTILWIRCVLWRRSVAGCPTKAAYSATVRG